MSGAAGSLSRRQDRLAPALSLTDATLLVVSSVIGSGIFLTPGSVAALLPRPGLFLAAWLVGGLLSLAGALTNAELGAMYPHAGGDYVYLREGYGEVAGFLIGWLSFFVIYAGTIATLAAAFAEGVTAGTQVGEAGTIGIAIGVTVAASAINYVGVRPSAVVNNVGAWAKVIVLGALVIAVPLTGRGDLGHFRPFAGTTAEIPWSSFGLALSPVLFTYLGWNAPVYVASELHQPTRNLPRSLFLGLGICTAVYLAVDAIYVYALGVTALGRASNAGIAAAEVLLGAGTSGMASTFILVSILGTLHATILVGPRIAYAMAIDRLFFAGADRVHELHQTPHRAIVVQAIVAIGLLVVLRRFPSVLDYTTFAIVLATMADTAVLYRLRRCQPARPRPYRAWGYPLVPAVYLVANAGIAAVLCLGRPLECAIGIAVVAAGMPFYWILARRR